MSAPLRSMTGAGRFVFDTDFGRFEADARSVNHRFLKTSVRLHGGLPPLESDVEARVKGRAERGHVTVHVRFVPAGAAFAKRVDGAAFAEAALALRSLAEAAGLPAPTVADIVSAPGVLGDVRASLDEAVVAPALAEAVDGALDQLVHSRETEGAHLASEVTALLDGIEIQTAALEARAAEIPGLFRARMERRLGELLEDRNASVDPQWLAREVALLAEKADVREEIARLQAHVAHGREIVAEGGASGRRLDFLVQELHREVNTVSSKSSDLALTRVAMDLKADVERLREQVQNLE